MSKDFENPIKIEGNIHEIQFLSLFTFVAFRHRIAVFKSNLSHFLTLRCRFAFSFSYLLKFSRKSWNFVEFSSKVKMNSNIVVAVCLHCSCTASQLRAVAPVSIPNLNKSRIRNLTKYTQNHYFWLLFCYLFIYFQFWLFFGYFCFFLLLFLFFSATFLLFFSATFLLFLLRFYYFATFLPFFFYFLLLLCHFSANFYWPIILQFFATFQLL